MTLRRVFEGPAGQQILVMYNQASDEFHVCTRPEPDWTWSPPWPCVRTDDDREAEQKGV